MDPKGRGRGDVMFTGGEKRRWWMVKCSGGFSSDFAVIILAQVRK